MTPTALLVGVSGVARPSWSTLLGGWDPDPLLLVVIAVAVLYASGVRRLASRGRAWSRARSGAFAGGLLVIAFATQSGFARYDTVLFSTHVIQHLLLGMLAPVLLVLGAPLTLALQASGRRTRSRLLRLLHGRPVAVLTHPLVVWVWFGTTLVVLYFTDLYALSLRDPWVHTLIHAHFVVVGCLFMAYVIGVDPLPRAFGYGGRMLFVAVVLPFHAFLGVALLGERRVLASGWYAGHAPAWATNPLADQRLGAGMLWAVGEMFGLVALGIVLYQWMRHDEAVAARADRAAVGDPGASTRVRAGARSR